nr:DUF1846 domain-containing protein [Actinomyces pacaensis]
MGIRDNRDIEAFPVLRRLPEKIMGTSPYQSPTDMGVNMAGFCAGSDGGPLAGRGLGGSRGTPAPRTTVSRPTGASTPKQTLKPEETRVGDRVRHATLGEGVIIGLEGAGERTIAEVAFASAKKRLLLRMAPMEKI